MTEFNAEDLLQIQKNGLTVEEVNKQIDLFKTGFPYVNITEPASANNGILCLTENEIENLISLYDADINDYSVVKFVPASGAATRMFKDLFEYLSDGKKTDVVQKVLANINRFAFYDDLKGVLPDTADDKTVISRILYDDGLGYGNLPKALIKFHKYDQVSVTALEEHLVEGAQYACSNGSVKIHFTVSPEHRSGFEKLLNTVLDNYQSVLRVKYEISMSEQKKSTDTIAVNPDNTVFRDSDGRLLFRPAGHGALIENLNDLDADIIFIKNIDNVCVADKRADAVRYKKALAGLLIRLQKRVFGYLRNWSETPDFIEEVKDFLSNELQQKNLPDDASAQYYKDLLNRPMRVCGMVKNTGAPGGGPFWVKSEDDVERLQIIESSQIAPAARDIMNKSSHFNPVDLVCGIKDYLGNKFNLKDFVDEATGFISEKTKSGKALRAMERPGLWNGAMAHWISIFVDVPVTTFSPVKYVSDLLLPEHQSKRGN